MAVSQDHNQILSLGLGRRRLLGQMGAVMAGLSGGLLLAPKAFAHRQKRAITSLEWNSRVKTLEVTHAFHLHDAEQALSRLGILDTPDLTGLRARAKLCLYIQKHFLIDILNDDTDGNTPSSDKNSRNLEILGAEVKSGEIFVYQEMPLKHLPKHLSITNNMFLSVYKDQTNFVNVTAQTEIKSVIFKAGDPAKQVSL